METISALFSAMWNSLIGAAWFQFIKWPFWTFLILIAVGGMYNAQFQKNTLFCRGITGALKLALIYLCSFGLHLLIPPYMSTVSQFPFLYVSETAVTLVNPIGLIDRPLRALLPVLVRLYLLLLCLNTAGYFDYGGKNFIPWFFSQVATCFAGLFFFEFCAAIIGEYNPLSSYVTNIIFGGILLLPLVFLLGSKVFFIVTKSSGSHLYSVVSQFFTKQRFGALFSVSFFSFLAVLVFLVIINAFDKAHIAISSFSRPAYLLIILMCIGCLYVYSMLYTERKGA